MGIHNVRTIHQHDAGIDKGMSHEDGPIPARRIDGKLNKKERRQRLEKVEDWHVITTEAHAGNRYEMRTDFEFYDHTQLTTQDIAILNKRFQAPLVFNKIKSACDLLIGTERRSRVDYKVLPRTEDDVEDAHTKESLLKYISDASRTPFERSRAFEDTVKGGVGWMEEGVRGDEDEEPVFERYVPWASIMWDAQSRRDDLDDCRFMFRSMWLDLDVAVQMFPDHKDALVNVALQSIFADSEQSYEDDLPALFQQTDHFGRARFTTTHSSLVGAPRKARRRVRITECWHKVFGTRRRIWSADSFVGEDFDEANDTMVADVDSGKATLTDGITMQMEVVIFVPGTMLYHQERPYKHNRFPFTPIWCYRRDRDGMPYGIIRGARDAQKDFNKRMSLALFALSSKQTLYEENTIVDEDEWQEQVSNPTGMLKVITGALKEKRVVRENNNDLAQGHIQLANMDAQHIMDVSGATLPAMGLDPNAQSGVAVTKNQNQSQLTSAAVFDNLRLSVQLGGEKTLSLAEQFITAARQIRITGETGGQKFLKLNEPVFDEKTGQWVWHNDISRTQADFKVDQQEFRESMRIALGEQLLELVGQLPPEIGLQLLDLVVEMIDVPQREKIVERIRSITGVQDQDADPNSEEALAKADAQAAEDDQEARAIALEEASMVADIKSKAATAMQREGQAVKSVASARLDQVDVDAANRFFAEGGTPSEFIHEE